MTFEHTTLELPNSICLLKLPAERQDEDIMCTVSEYTQWYYLGPSATYYLALSYTWSDASNQRTILLNGKQFSVRQNLWSCLWQLREDLEVYTSKSNHEDHFTLGLANKPGLCL